ncbi:hypothetical protein [Kingella sp. (in: b-proteobacteria)]|uniref:hypothetical protein n=1 Tax=Kingella sp. (in: b-proteobacteria) TaxID=2020713 RepID=UPI0026DB75F0|nr:hypothetical protein [Kingella sp. (in: b-proteobacteria)]MDO4657086.1 hypothetical protein [Kingella sp. (in: b-proteobacteria)]
MSGINARPPRYGFSGCLNAGRMPKQPERANRAPTACWQAVRWRGILWQLAERSGVAKLKRVYNSGCISGNAD